MKKFIAILAVVTMLLGFGTTAMAGYAVVTSLTSEAITGLEGSCDKFGAVTWTFKAGTIIRDGDWMYLDLPKGVTVCKAFDFVILGDSSGTGVEAKIPSGITLPNVGGNGVWVTTAVPNGTTVDYGPWNLTDLGQDDTGANNGITVTSTTGAKGLFARVIGAVGSQRIQVTFYDNEALLFGPTGIADGSTTLKVDADAEFELTLFDGEKWNSNLPVTTKNPLSSVWCVKDTDGDAVFGDDLASDFLQSGANLKGELWDNYICAVIDSTYKGGDVINVSFDSGGQSGDDFLTFSGQKEIAHIIGATTISLTSCAKAETCGYVKLVDEQTDICTYYYSSPSPKNYCGNYVGDKFVLYKPDRFGPATTTEYYVELRVKTSSASGHGTYFATNSATILGVNGGKTTDVCSLSFAAQGLADYYKALAWTPTTRTGVAFGSYPSGVGCGTVAEKSQVTILRSPTFDSTNALDKLIVEIPTLAFSPALLANGDSASVQIDLYQSPCGKVFSGSRCVANYVTNCSAALPTSTLLFPYSVALDYGDPSGGWWFGMSFCNPSEDAGTALITCYEKDGDVSTYDVGSVAAGGMVVFTGVDLLSKLTLTPDNAGPGTLGNAACHIVVQCNFGFAGGFGMMGNGSDSTGYAAYSIGGKTPGNWFED